MRRAKKGKLSRDRKAHGGDTRWHRASDTPVLPRQLIFLKIKTKIREHKEINNCGVGLSWAEIQKEEKRTDWRWKEHPAGMHTNPAGRWLAEQLPFSSMFALYRGERTEKGTPSSFPQCPSCSKPSFWARLAHSWLLLFLTLLEQTSYSVCFASTGQLHHAPTAPCAMLSIPCPSRRATGSQNGRGQKGQKGGHLVQPLLTYSRLPKTKSRWLLKTSKELCHGAAPPSRGTTGNIAKRKKRLSKRKN